MPPAGTGSRTVTTCRAVGAAEVRQPICQYVAAVTEYGPVVQPRNRPMPLVKSSPVAGTEHAQGHLPSEHVADPGTPTGEPDDERLAMIFRIHHPDASPKAVIWKAVTRRF
jgi:hypothetical protein